MANTDHFRGHHDLTLGQVAMLTGSEEDPEPASPQKTARADQHCRDSQNPLHRIGCLSLAAPNKLLETNIHLQKFVWGSKVSEYFNVRVKGAISNDIEQFVFVDNSQKGV